MPKFSIIIPVYNVAPYLRECLDSVLAQTFTDWEAICVDDGSTDDGGNILDEYAAADSRLRVVHQANSGVSAARNVALTRCVGEWVWCVDGDDLIAKGALARLNSFISENLECDLIRFEHSQVWPILNGEMIDGPVLFDMKEEGQASAMLRHAAGMLLWNSLFRRDLIQGLRFGKYSNGEDQLFAFEALMRSSCPLYVNIPLYYYRVGRSGSAASTMNLRHLGDLCKVHLEIVRTYSKWRMSQLCLTSFSYCFKCVLCYLIWRSRELDATELMKGRMLIMGLVGDSWHVQSGLFKKMGLITVVGVIFHSWWVFRIGVTRPFRIEYLKRKLLRVLKQSDR